MWKYWAFFISYDTLCSWNIQFDFMCQPPCQSFHGKCGGKKEDDQSKPFLASAVFSRALDKVVICSSSPLPDLCSPSSFVPISSSLKPSGAHSFLPVTLSWQTHTRSFNDLCAQWNQKSECFTTVCASVRPLVGHPQFFVELLVAPGGC